MTHTGCLKQPGQTASKKDYASPKKDIDGLRGKVLFLWRVPGSCPPILVQSAVNVRAPMAMCMLMREVTKPRVRGEAVKRAIGAGRAQRP